MTDNHSGTRSRVRRSERAQHFYAARTFSDEEIKNEEQPSNAQALDKKKRLRVFCNRAGGRSLFAQRAACIPERSAGNAIRPMTFLHRLTSRAAEGNAPQIDFSAYYRRDGSASEGDGIGACLCAAHQAGFFRL